MKYEWQTIGPVPPSHSNGGKWQVISKKKKFHRPDKTKNMKIKKTKSGVQSPEDRERPSRSLFDPCAPGDRFFKL